MKKRFGITALAIMAVSLIATLSVSAASPLLSTSHLSVKGSYIKDVPLSSTGTQLKSNLISGATGAVTSSKLKSGDTVTTSAGTYTVIIDGDVNGDGSVTSTDYVSIKSAFAGTKTLSAWALEAADVSRDGKLSTVDYMKIRQYFSGMRDLYSEMDILPVRTNEYTGPYSADTGAYGGIDDLGREQLYDTQTTSGNSSKEVGIFYFFAQGNHGPYNIAYDNNLIVQNNPDAITSESAWLAAGGGMQNYQHFWGKPVFGYYRGGDVWVIRKHVEMLTATGIDYIVIDATNGFTYDGQCLYMMSLLKEYHDQGYDVPKIAYYTNTDSEATVEHLYNDVYMAHPEYSDIWYKINNKPLIIGKTTNTTIKNFFYFRAPQWPNTGLVTNGFPWMEFSRWNTSSAIYTLAAGKTVTSVSPAQHNQTCLFSASAWYGYNDRVRSYGYAAAGLTKEQGMLQGINYQNTWNFALSKNVSNIFITGFNEWVAGRLEPQTNVPIRFCDCADPNASRDIEPMDGVLKDNYLMQTANYIKQFKSAESRVNVGKKKTIFINDEFDQWDNVPAVYTDFTGETGVRAAVGFGTSYSDTSGRNDFKTMKVCHDNNSIYFYAETVADYQRMTAKVPVMLFLRSKGTSTSGLTWEGYDYKIVLNTLTDTTATLSKSKGGWNWEDIGTVNIKLEGNKLMIEVPKSMINISKTELLDLQFKWFDSRVKFTGDIMQLYSAGDTAPYGRYHYIFSQVKK